MGLKDGFSALAAKIRKKPAVIRQSLTDTSGGGRFWRSWLRNTVDFVAIPAFKDSFQLVSPRGRVLGGFTLAGNFSQDFNARLAGGRIAILIHPQAFSFATTRKPVSIDAMHQVFLPPMFSPDDAFRFLGMPAKGLFQMVYVWKSYLESVEAFCTKFHVTPVFIEPLWMTLVRRFRNEGDTLFCLPMGKTVELCIASMGLALGHVSIDSDANLEGAIGAMGDNLTAMGLSDCVVRSVVILGDESSEDLIVVKTLLDMAEANESQVREVPYEQSAMEGVCRP